MLRVERRTGFEWLDMPFFITRVLISLWGFVMAVMLLAVMMAVVGELQRHSKSDGEEEEAHARTRCFETPSSPYGGLAVAFWIMAPAVGGMILVWRKPRIGFTLAAGSWFMIGALGSLPGREFDWRPLALWLLPSLWLGYAAWKVPPPPPPSPDLILAVEEPDPDFEWLDAALEWLLTPFRRRGVGP